MSASPQPPPSLVTDQPVKIQPPTSPQRHTSSSAAATSTSASTTAGVGFCSSVSFRALCEVLDRIATAAGGKKEQLQYVENLWRKLRAANAAPSEHHQLLRLLMPQLDSKRATYGLKESKIARFYVELLGLSEHSPDAVRFKNWKDPSKSAVDTTAFSDAVYVMLVKRGFSGEGRGISISECNATLDSLSAADGIDQRKQIFMQMLRTMSATEQKWLIRIVMKEMKMRLSHTAILSAFHPQATEQFNCTNDLLHVCEKCLTESALAAAGPLAAGGVGLMRPFKPMLASVVESDKLQVLLRDERIIVEPKFDGERLLVHYHRQPPSSTTSTTSQAPTCAYFTRNCKDYTAAYGAKLSPSVQAFFASSATKVTNCILDAEVLLYDKAKRSYVAFGQNRTFALGGIIGGAGSGALMGQTNGEDNTNDGGGSTQQQPHQGGVGHEFHLMVFDIIYLNNESLCATPLDKRKGYLRQLFSQPSSANPKLIALASIIRLVPYQPVTTLKEILVCMDDALGNSYEGVMIKLAASHYIPGERKAKWTKLKPDHISGIADTLDLVVLGAYYGTKYGQRRLSHFLLGALDTAGSGALAALSSSGGGGGLQRQPSQSSTNRYKTVCKVGSGYNDAELAEILAVTDGKWFALTPGAPVPAWLGGWKAGAGEVPDVLIDPQDSVVMEVYGYSFQETTKFSLGLTIRFPRFSRLRFDKGVLDANDVPSLGNIAAASNQLMKRVQDLDTLTMIRKERQKDRKGAGRGKTSTSLLPPRQFVFGSKDVIGLPDASTIHLVSNLFDGHEFCILQTTMEVAERSELERLIISHAGAVVANPQIYTTIILAVSRTSTKVRNWINSCEENPSGMADKFMSTDLVHVKWVLQCIALRRLIPFTPSLMVYVSPTLQARFAVALDEYKDSYFDPCTTETLAYSMRLAGAKRARSEGPVVVSDVGGEEEPLLATQVRTCEDLVAKVALLRWRVLGPPPTTLHIPTNNNPHTTYEGDNEDGATLMFPRVDPRHYANSQPTTSAPTSSSASPTPGQTATRALLGLEYPKGSHHGSGCMVEMCNGITKFLS